MLFIMVFILGRYFVGERKVTVFFPGLNGGNHEYRNRNEGGIRPFISNE